MSSYGTRTIGQSGRVLQVSADGMPDRKVGGVTIDWDTVAAVGADTTLADESIIKAGDKYLRYGTVLTKITATGKYGPYASGATDGRQTLTRGACYILNLNTIRSHAHSDHPDVLEGGLLIRARVTDIAANPAIADLNTAFPAVRWVTD